MARRSQSKQYSVDSFSINIDKSLTNKLDQVFENFADDVMRPGAFAASTVIYDEMQLLVPEKTGQLKSAIYRYREKNGSGNEAIFYIGPNKRKAPHWSLVEHGHFQIYQVYFDPKIDDYRTNVKQPLAVPKLVPAQPYIRPTFDAKISQALQAGLDEMHKRLGEKFNQKPQLY